MSRDGSLFWCFVDFFLIFFFLSALFLLWSFFLRLCISVELHFFYANFMWNHKNDKTLTNQMKMCREFSELNGNSLLSLLAKQINGCALCITTNRIFMLNFCPYFSFSLSLFLAHSLPLILSIFPLFLSCCCYSLFDCSFHGRSTGWFIKTASESWTKLFFNMK